MSVPDAKYTKGEFEVSPGAGSVLGVSFCCLKPQLLVWRGWILSQGGREAPGEALLLLPMLQVVMKVVQLLPDGHRMKKEVDMALDTVSETMTPMHYHLREIIICTYRQVSPPLPIGTGQFQRVQPGSGTSPARAGWFLGLKLSGVSPERCQGSCGHAHPGLPWILCCPTSCLSLSVPHHTHHTQHPAHPAPTCIPHPIQHPVRRSRQRAGLVCPAPLPAPKAPLAPPGLGRRFSFGKGSRPWERTHPWPAEPVGHSPVLLGSPCGADEEAKRVIFIRLGIF